MRSPGRPDHLDTGTWFILLAIVAGLVGGTLSLCLRVPSLMQGPAGRAWHAAALQHGPIMVAFSAIPALLGGFGTRLVPMQIGATGTAFPRLGMLSVVSTASGFALVLVGLLPGEPVGLLLAALYLSGFAILLCAANLIATMLNMRRPGMSLGGMPVFAWSQLIASCLAVATAPLLMACLTLLALHRMAAAPLQHLFLFLGTPGICIMILPALGLVSEIVSGLSGRPLAGRRTAIAAMAVLALAGYLDWAHRLLAGQLGSDGSLSRSALLLPALVMIGCWGATLRRGGRLRPMLAHTPGLFALGFMIVLLAGAVAGLRSSQPMHDGLALGAVFAMFAGTYWWIGRLTGKAYPEGLGRLQFWLLLAGVGLMPLSQGLLAAFGAALASLSVLVFALMLAVTLLRRSPAGAVPWDVDAAELEWSRPSPVRVGFR